MTTKELFMNTYAEKIYELKQVHNFIKRLLIFQDDNDEKTDLNKVMKNSAKIKQKHNVKNHFI